MQMSETGVWFCQECRTMMEHHEEGFDKCPSCGAEAWPSGEASYQRERPKAAALAQKIHGVWYCQRCRVPMVPVDGDYCKCPECTAEVWYGTKKRDGQADMQELMETTEEFPVFLHAGEVCMGTGGGRPARGGGSHSGKSRHKANMQKPTTEELYRRLCNS
jgi:DNA-directed RNA polymerase subunit M/transcription elongation factor TFIIS